MKAFRISASVFALAALSLLAACGGGGGGGGVTPPGGGGGSTPPPTSTSSPGPTTTPSPTPSPTATSSVTVSGNVTAEEDWQNYKSLWYTSGTASWASTAGGTATAPSSSATVDGMKCQQITEGTTYPQSKFSQHAFVGIYNGTTWEDLPQAIGMVSPVAPTAGNPSHPNNFYAVENNQCEFNMHTHDYSGLVHIVDPTLTQSNTNMPAYATLKGLFDVWGAQLTSAGIVAGTSALSGPTTVYYGTPSGRDSSGNDIVTSYTQFTGDPNTLQFSKHMAVWIVVNPGSTVTLPQVTFVITN